MSTRSAGLDQTAGQSLEQVAERLSAGARRWTGQHAGYLDSPAGRAELPVTPRVKALLQLALLCHYWRRTAPADTALGEATAVVERAWQRPDFPRLLTLGPRTARQFQLMYAALAPPGAATGAGRTALARLAADGYLTADGEPRYPHLWKRFYAELAGADHRLAPYRELYATSALARAGAGQPVDGLDVCHVTHTVFYLSDFGFRDPGLPGPARERALDVMTRLTDRCVRDGAWDLVAKLLLAQHCLGVNPLRTPSGAAGVRMLARAQTPEGAIPGRSAAERAPATATPVEFFRCAYQATLGTALAMLVVTRGTAGAAGAAGSAGSAGTLGRAGGPAEAAAPAPALRGAR
ncbi:DUF6895 family protein [Streptomyces sp. YIM 98790]|uniref:DUF6895 family protein n=1 Tax=Streptomyces sp. YIM 98790 TaxID=2689077 RepID=UPI001FB70C55|nr:hypothetical protein [Streptomyces sp. YIM 98790]